MAALDARFGTPLQLQKIEAKLSRQSTELEEIEGFEQAFTEQSNGEMFPEAVRV